MFYQFRQNNSGGSFTYDENNGISVNVIIEANSVDEANMKAESIGLYFDGCDSGLDCECCGDRWYEQWHNEEGDLVPSVYDSPVNLSTMELDDEEPPYLMKWMEGYEGFIHYSNGKMVGFN